MEGFPDSELLKRLIQDGIRGKGAGTPKLRGKGKADAKGGTMHRPTGWGGSPVYLAWENTAMRRAAGKSTARLMIVK